MSIFRALAAAIGKYHVLLHALKRYDNTQVPASYICLDIGTDMGNLARRLPCLVPAT